MTETYNDVFFVMTKKLPKEEDRLDGLVGYDMAFVSIQGKPIPYVSQAEDEEFISQLTGIHGYDPDNYTVWKLTQVK